MSDEQPTGSGPAWDRIIERDQQATPELEAATPSAPPAPDRDLKLAVFAAAWADLVCMVAVCTLGLAALVAMGHRANLSVLPWGMALGVLWWSAAAAVTVTVRRGTPGMLMAGVVAGEPVAPRRIPLVLATAFLSSLLGGLPAVLGGRRSALRAALGSDLMELTARANEV